MSDVSLREIRLQASVVRVLLDEVEAADEPEHSHAPREQFIEELARLGCRILETASALARTTPR
jgi:hypothetical protein